MSSICPSEYSPPPSIEIAPTRAGSPEWTSKMYFDLLGLWILVLGKGNLGIVKLVLFQKPLDVLDRAIDLFHGKRLAQLQF